MSVAKTLAMTRGLPYDQSKGRFTELVSEEMPEYAKDRRQL